MEAPVPFLRVRQGKRARQQKGEAPLRVAQGGRHRHSRPRIQQLRDPLQAIAPKVSGWVSEANCEAAARPRADMGCAFDASGYAIYQVQVSGSVQLFALRRIYLSRYVAEKGSYAEPLVLWDSND